MTSFGKQQLMKYGWTKGKGLGILENGMTDALKPKLKFGTAGIGHDIAEEFTFHWWDHVYNKAAQNLKVEKEEDGNIQIRKQKDLTVSTKKPSKFKIQNGKGLYDYFIRGNILNGPVEPLKEVDSDSSDDDKDYSSSLSDDQLFKICGGLTAHKGARHGLTMSAKLDRLEKQDQLIFQEQQSLQQQKSSLLESGLLCSPGVIDKIKPILKENTPASNNHKKRKSVQFNEDLRLKIFSYCIDNCDKETDISIKMEDDETPSSALAVYVEEFSLENNISLLGATDSLKKRKKKLKNFFQNDQDVWELIGSSLDCDDIDTESVQAVIDEPSLESKKKKKKRKVKSLQSCEQEKENAYSEKPKKKKKKLHKIIDAETSDQISFVNQKVLNISDSQDPIALLHEASLELDNNKSKKKKKLKIKFSAENCNETEDFCCKSRLHVDIKEADDELVSCENLLAKSKKVPKNHNCVNVNLVESTMENNDDVISQEKAFESPLECHTELKKKKFKKVENTETEIEDKNADKTKEKKKKRKLEEEDFA